MDWYVVVSIGVAAAMLFLWWQSRRAPAVPVDTALADDRLDTLVGWPPEPMRILRPAERDAYSILKRALPGYTILAQIQVSRFVAVPRRNSYGEWMRRVGSQCVDLVACDPNSQVVAVIDIRPVETEMSDRVRRRFARVDRTLKGAGIPIHVWEEGALPSVGDARLILQPGERRAFADTAPQTPEVPSGVLVTELSNGAGSATEDLGGEVIEMPEPSTWTWFDEIEATSATPAPEPRPIR